MGHPREEASPPTLSSKWTSVSIEEQGCCATRLTFWPALLVEPSHDSASITPTGTMTTQLDFSWAYRTDKAVWKIIRIHRRVRCERKEQGFRFPFVVCCKMRMVHGPSSISRHSTYPHVIFSQAAIHLTVPNWELRADRASLSQLRHPLENLFFFPCMGSPPQTSPHHDRRNDAQACENMLRVYPSKDISNRQK
jgi:hypothetical protein